MITQSKVERHERLLDICKAVIADPRSADADTVAAFKSAVRRFLKSYPDLPEEEGLRRLFESQGELGDALRDAVAVLPTSRVDDGDADEIAKARNRDYVGAQGLGSAIMNHALDRLDHLRRKHGFSKTAKDHSMDIETLKAERTQNLLEIGKRGGAVAMAKILVADNDAHGIDESEYTRIVTEHAQKLYPAKMPDSAFATVFSDTGPDGVLLRKAHAVVKSAPFQPTMVGGVDAQNEANDDTEASEAYRQLAELGQQRWPNERPDVQFSRAFGLRPDLAVKVHRRPSAPAGGMYAFPR